MISVRYLLIFLLTFSCVSAQTEKEYYNQIQSETIMQNIDSFDNRFEKLNIDWLEKNGQKRNMGNSFSYLYESETDREVVQIYGSRKKGYSKFQHFSDSYFKLIKYYYPNGNIKEKGWMINNSQTKRGVWHEFDENGKLIKSTDFDTVSEFTINDVFRFCRLENIPVEKGYVRPSTGNHTIINRFYDDANKSYRWYVGWMKNYELRENIILDGKTGRVISREDVEVINN